MSKQYFCVAILSVVSLILALIYLLAYMTQTVNVQVVVIQSFYRILDHVAGIGRVIACLLVAFVTAVLAIVFNRELGYQLSTRSLGYIFLFTTGGVILGLLVYYAYVCCDSPVIFYFGFPLSWMRGVTNSWNFLPSPSAIYIIQNLSDFRWNLVIWNFFASFLFWFNAGFILFAIQKLRWSFVTAKKDTQIR